MGLPRLPVKWRLPILMAALAMLAALGWTIGQRVAEREHSARPALWLATKGPRQVYLFGTLHAVPRDVRWLSPQIEQAIRNSDLLLLEVTGLEAERSSHAMFERLGRSPRLPSIEARLSPGDVPAFRRLEAAHHSELRELHAYESWAAALLINAVASGDLGLTTQDAAEAVLERRFSGDGKNVAGLETIFGQLGLFDTLPEADQRHLLEQAVRDSGDAERLYRELYEAWASGNVDQLQRQFVAPLSRAPGLKLVLIDARNWRWSDAIDRGYGASTTQFVAVGAGHLVGTESVQAQLSRRGWKIDRLQ